MPFQSRSSPVASRLRLDSSRCNLQTGLKARDMKRGEAQESHPPQTTYPYFAVKNVLIRVNQSFVFLAPFVVKKLCSPRTGLSKNPW
jgi:hypothetical protein